MTQNQPPFIDPIVPFSSVIPGGLQDGMIFTVCGRVSNDADRFNVNLQHDNDVVLQVNPRYQWLAVPGYVVHNTRQNGKWGWEERKYETPFPRGQTFALQILVTQEAYKIFANGTLFSEYKHRMQFSLVNRIHVIGMVDLSLVTFHFLAPQNPVLPGSLTVPYKSIIYGGVQPGKCFIIHGVVIPQANRVGFSLRHKTGIAFDFSPRFDENVVVMNCYEDGSWGEEERDKLMPFQRGQAFQMMICCSSEDYNVFVKGKKTHSYSRRYNIMEEIDVLEISGDVQLTFVQP